MHSIVYTGRLLSRALWNGITSYTNNTPEATVSRKREPRIVHAVCGFPKEFTQSRLKKGQFGDDAWFHAKNKTTEVLGKVHIRLRMTTPKSHESYYRYAMGSYSFLIFFRTRTV